MPKSRPHRPPARPAKGARAGRERGDAASKSLEQLKLLGAWLAQRPTFPVLDGRLRAHRAAPRFGLSRDQALDLIATLCEMAGVQPTYAKILRGSADVFGRLGTDATQLGDLLTSAGVSRRTFYQFFLGTSDVLAALQDALLTIWTEVARAAVAQAPDGGAALRELVRVELGAFTLAGWLVRVLLAEAQRPGSPLAARHEVFVAQREALLGEVLARLDRRADPRSVRARLGAGLGALVAVDISPLSNEEQITFAERELTEIWTGAGRPA